VVVELAAWGAAVMERAPRPMLAEVYEDLTAEARARSDSDRTGASDAAPYKRDRTACRAGGARKVMELASQARRQDSLDRVVTPRWSSS
jgi:hypothetical protein